MIALPLLAIFFTVVFLWVKNPVEISEEDYELYFRTQVMGMTVSTLLTPEVQQMLMERLEVPRGSQGLYSETETLANFNRYQKKDDKDDEVK